MSRRRERQAAELRALERLRGRIVTAIHTGHLNPGDRLPSYRTVAEESGLDLRAAARVYAALQDEGLVEVRGRSGVVVAPQERIGGRVLAETARWAVGVFAAGWRRRIPVPKLSEFLERCVETIRVRAACVESIEDVRLALCDEVRTQLGIDTSPVPLAALVEEGAGARPDRLLSELRDADLLVTTTFHVAALRPIATRLGRPLVGVRLDPDLVLRVKRELAQGGIVVVCVDPSFEKRLAEVVGEALAGGIRLAVLRPDGTIPPHPPGLPILLTRAAAGKLGQNRPDTPFPEWPVLATDSAEELIELLLRLNLEAMRESGGGGEGE
ncbi:MAG: GntR family transcriptional regulator [Gemmatimonadetes bacterium]|nr:GntR family transcriptional regulator [Gemmatimonadota bacterium]